MRYYVDADKVSDVIYDTDLDESMKNVLIGAIDGLKKPLEKVIGEANVIHIDHVDRLEL